MAVGRFVARKDKIKILKQLAYLMPPMSDRSHLAGPWTK
jgi:hypothetical protein